MLLLAAGLLIAALSRRRDVAAPVVRPVARSEDGTAVVLSFPKEKKRRAAKGGGSKANRGRG